MLNRTGAFEVVEQDRFDVEHQLDLVTDYHPTTGDLVLPRDAEVVPVDPCRRLEAYPAQLATVLHSNGAGLLTPVGTILVGSVMTTAILTAHARNGIWAAGGGFEFPLVLLALAFVISAVGAGSCSFNHWLMSPTGPESPAGR